MFTPDSKFWQFLSGFFEVHIGGNPQFEALTVDNGNYNEASTVFCPLFVLSFSCPPPHTSYPYTLFYPSNPSIPCLPCGFRRYRTNLLPPWVQSARMQRRTTDYLVQPRNDHLFFLPLARSPPVSPILTPKQLPPQKLHQPHSELVRHVPCPLIPGSNTRCTVQRSFTTSIMLSCH